jgi:hypothetical protein
MCSPKVAAIFSTFVLLGTIGGAVYGIFNHRQKKMLIFPLDRDIFAEERSSRNCNF